MYGQLYVQVAKLSHCFHRSFGQSMELLEKSNQTEVGALVLTKAIVDMGFRWGAQPTLNLAILGIISNISKYSSESTFQIS